ncbi:SHOCT domain-containing protein [uncultured Ruminococcus sp.]|uniref:SHOCT domain-containing protein n=1 Tax=uncultured Ruminococcus sp. TaxID=165186 RepID=UPI0025EE36B5|nr:SHOCT domain-containing protein [uncultured Ruminococcus sp.]
MNDTDLIKREMSYQVQMLLTKKLLRMGLLTDSEYAEIDTILRQKFRPSLSVFISEST